jgi:hypothetical protein
MKTPLLAMNLAETTEAVISIVSLVMTSVRLPRERRSGRLKSGNWPLI